MEPDAQTGAESPTRHEQEGRSSPARLGVDDLVLVERVRLLHSRARIAQGITILNAALVVRVYWGIASGAACSGWLAYICAVAAFRMLGVRAYVPRSRDAVAARWWARFYTLGAGFNGIGWGVFAALFLRRGSLTHEVFLVFVVGGMAAGSATTNAVSTPAVAAFAVPALLPVVVVLVAMGDGVHVAMGAMAVTFSLVVAMVSRSGGHATVEAIRLRFTNEALLAEQRRSQAVLRVAEEELRLTIDHAPIGIALVGRDGRLLRVNLALCEIVGQGPDELLRCTLQGITHPDDLARGKALAERLLQGEIPRCSSAARLVRKDGGTVDVMLHASLIRDDCGRPRHCIVQVEDVTERKRVEAQLVARDRLASIGTLAAGVAHEINNPLAYIKSNLDLAAEYLRGLAGSSVARDPELAVMVDEAREGAERVRKIVRGLKTFSRADEEQRTVIDVRSVLETAISMAFNEIKHRATLVKRFESVPDVHADESRLVQVFTNLLVNAAQAIPEGQANCNAITITTRSDGRGWALVEVRDTGRGISEADLSRVFEPFFTTKPVGVGTGLGLSVCHGIVSGLGGEIGVESAIGRGTSFRVVLPPADVVARRLGVAPGSESTPAVRRAQVLVVDDDPLVGAVVRRALACDHDVTVVESGAAALAHIREGVRYDVIFCDLMMPVMTGMELHAQLADLDGRQADRMVFATGGAFTSAARAFLERVPHARLEKPFGLRELRALVKRIVSPRAP